MAFRPAGGLGPGPVRRARLPAAVLGALRRRNDAARFGNAIAFFVEFCRHQADLAVQPLQELCLMMPADHPWDPREATVFGGILRQSGRS